MAKILIIGVAPLPLENQKKNYALNNRTWLVSKALMEEGHDVRLIASRVRGAYFDEESLDSVHLQNLAPNLAYYSVSRDIFNKKLLTKFCRDLNPDCIVGVGTVPSSLAVQIKTGKPIWADLFGSLLAEAQAKAEVYGDNFYTSYWRKFEVLTLKRADMFSAVSMPQKYALVGELGMLGRLNRYTLNYDFVQVMPICLDEEPFQHQKNILRNVRVKDDDFIIFWSGGYNTWTDAETLFRGLIKAMERNEKIKFVSTGGAIDRHDDVTFAKFCDDVRQSKFQDRFIFLGWVPTADVPNCYLESDIGINIDRFSYEAMLGARNRINEMIKAGLPIITTRISEISTFIEANSFGLTFPIGDSDGLATAILSLADNSELLKKYKENLSKYPLQNLSYRKILRPLIDWVRSPKVAPDFGKKVNPRILPFFGRAQYAAREASFVRKNRGTKEVIRQAKGYLKGLTKRKY